MDTFPSGSKTVFARCISAEIRSRIAVAKDVTGQKLAVKIGRSQNYVAERLRDEKPFTVDDIELVARFFDDAPGEFVQSALRHLDLVYDELEAAWDAARASSIGPIEDGEDTGVEDQQGRAG